VLRNIVMRNVNIEGVKRNGGVIAGMARHHPRLLGARASAWCFATHHIPVLARSRGPELQSGVSLYISYQCSARHTGQD